MVMALLRHPACRSALRWALTLFLLAAGANHFVTAEAHIAMVPPVFPAPLVLVYVSGALQILGALLLIPAATRRAAAWGVIVLLVLLFPANVHMAVNHLPFGTRQLPDWILWARLPLQAVFIAWAWWFTHPDES
jgi:uncharacterized membrane protein